MKNLVILNKGNIIPESLSYPDLEVVDAVFDLVTDSITFALSSEDSGVVEVQKFSKNGSTELLASFPINGNLISFSHFSDSYQLAFVFDNGDVVAATYEGSLPDPDTTIVEIVGSIDKGILTASWSPDDELLALLTTELNVIILSRMFEPISERTLNPEDIKITDSKHVSVGWGKKETQFKGKGARALEREKSALKHAGLEEGSPLRDPTVNQIERGNLSALDSKGAKISWRGDCEYFAVSTVEPVIEQDTQNVYDRRVIRVFNKEGDLDSVNEAADGLEHPLAWKPQGSLIASTQRHTDDEEDQVLDVLFYERNGLKRHHFNSRLNPDSDIIKSLQWSSDSELLVFHLDYSVQIWTTKNYHWYLKQEIKFDSQVHFVKFHPERPMTFMINTAYHGIFIIDLASNVVVGPVKSGNDAGMTLVVDGEIAKITPFLLANVPPPISYRELEVRGNISDLAVDISNEKYAVLTCESEISVAFVTLSEMKKGKSPSLVEKMDIKSIIDDKIGFFKQIAFVSKDVVAVLFDGQVNSKIVLFNVEGKIEKMGTFDFPSKITRIKSSLDFDKLVFEGMDGSIYLLDKYLTSQNVAKFPQLCYDFELVYTGVSAEDKKLTAFGLSTSGKLYANNKQIATGVTSIKATEFHLIYTTVQSQLFFLHLLTDVDNLSHPIIPSSDVVADERVRQIERGSIIINTMPSKYSVILEAPRGNLETISPRIMVLSAVRTFIKRKQFRNAFLTCRTHRIDLDILHDYSPKLFLENIEEFINQIHEQDHLDLFISCLHDQDVVQTKYKDTIGDSLAEEVQKLDLNTPRSPWMMPENTTKKIINNKEYEFTSPKVNSICRAILEVLFKPQYFQKYLQTIVTTYACQKPPNLDDALKLVSSIKNEEAKEQAVEKLCFLQDVNKLYYTTLGLYDVKMALNVAQHSQMDPKEYLPFLQNLHIQEPLRMKFLIDDHLKKYELALQWLFKMADVEEEFDKYTALHGLFKEALSMYKYDTKRFNEILFAYAENLHAQQHYVDAALAYEYLKEYESAMENYVLAKRWKEALSLLDFGSSGTVVVDVAERLVATLSDDHKYFDAAEIQYKLLGNVKEALLLYCKEYRFDTAILVAKKENQADLIELVVDEQLGEGFGVIAELIADCTGQINSQLKRLRELRSKKSEDPHSFYGVTDDSDVADNVSIAPSETSTAPSFFTRYTGKTAGTAKTGASRKTSKNKKREERKKAKGRKGTIYEEEYLVRSVGRLIDRLEHTHADAISLMESLIRRDKKEQAYEIQKNWTKLITLLKDNVNEIFTISERDRERVNDEGEIYLIPEILPPTIKDFSSTSILDY